MADEKIVRKVKEVFMADFEVDEADIKPEANVFMDLGLDSLDMVDLVVALQKKFDVQIRNDDRIRNIRTFGDICDFIEALRKENTLE